MIVTSIEQQKKDKSRYSVFIDGQFAFGLSATDIAYFKIKEGTEIYEETYRYITDTLVYIKAQDTALKFLSYKMRTEKEIVKKLYEKEFSEEIIAKVMAFLHKYGYVNDRKYCEAYIKESVRLKAKGRQLIKYELRERGISDSIISEAFENTEIDEVSSAVKLLRKKVRDFSDMDFKTKQKYFAMLQRKGYGYDVIKEAFSIASSDEYEE